MQTCSKPSEFMGKSYTTRVAVLARQAHLSRRPQVCNHLERLSVDLEAAAHPALDALTRKVPRIETPPHLLSYTRQSSSVG